MTTTRSMRFSIAVLLVTAVARGTPENNSPLQTDRALEYGSIDDTNGDGENNDRPVRACRKASAAQIAEVNRGREKVQEFLDRCAQETAGSRWCAQLTRPNPDSIGIFRCTYGTSQPHQLIHPDPTTWKYAFKAVRLIEQLEETGIQTCLIYNWWRPEPYNTNVGGSAGRHPFATSVDVRFCSKPEMESAFLELCRLRSQGQLRAIGYYGSTAIHFGVGDKTGNTWGKSCPSMAD